MKNGVARGSYIHRTCLDNVCDRESCATPENGQHGVNSSVDMNMQLVNVNGRSRPRHECTLGMIEYHNHYQ